MRLQRSLALPIDAIVEEARAPGPSLLASAETRVHELIELIASGRPRDALGSRRARSGRGAGERSPPT